MEVIVVAGGTTDLPRVRHFIIIWIRRSSCNSSADFTSYPALALTIA